MDTISKDERRLIDEAIARGRAQVIPMHVSSCHPTHKPGRKPDYHRIAAVKRKAAEGKNDTAIAREIGTTPKAISNCRYRHGITNGLKWGEDERALKAG